MGDYDPAHKGCTTCGSQDTETVDGLHGRRCADHAPTFDPAKAVDIAVRGWVDTAIAYVRWAA